MVLAVEFYPPISSSGILPHQPSLACKFWGSKDERGDQQTPNVTYLIPSRPICPYLDQLIVELQCLLVNCATIELGSVNRDVGFQSHGILVSGSDTTFVFLMNMSFGWRKNGYDVRHESAKKSPRGRILLHGNVTCPSVFGSDRQRRWGRGRYNVGETAVLAISVARIMREAPRTCMSDYWIGSSREIA